MSGISNSDQLAAKREELFINLYKKAFPAVAKYISHRGGSFDEAKDVFHDALVIYYENTSPASINNNIAWLVGIAKNLWLKKYKENIRNRSLDNIDVISADEGSPSTQHLMHFLATAGKKCMELLTSFYYDRLPLTEIAAQFGYSGIRSATVQKYKCLEKVRETIKEKSLTYEDFME